MIFSLNPQCSTININDACGFLALSTAHDSDDGSHLFLSSLKCSGRAKGALSQQNYNKAPCAERLSVGISTFIIVMEECCSYIVQGVSA